MAYKKFTEDYIREHWEEALDSRMTYYDIARKIRWGLSRDDLGELAWLHEGGKAPPEDRGASDGLQLPLRVRQVYARGIRRRAGGKRMNTYRVKRIDLSRVQNTDEYWKAVSRATIHYVNGLDGLREYCGGKLHRQRNGYAGINGKIEYVAERV